MVITKRNDIIFFITIMIKFNYVQAISIKLKIKKAFQKLGMPLFIL